MTAAGAGEGAAQPAGELSAEDAKLVTLARAALARAGGGAGAGAREAAAVRDDIGRTYVAAAVTLPGLRLTALQAVLVVAAASGAARYEAGALVGARDALTDDERALPVPVVHLVNSRANPRANPQAGRPAGPQAGREASSQAGPAGGADRAGSAAGGP